MWQETDALSAKIVASVDRVRSVWCLAVADGQRWLHSGVTVTVEMSARNDFNGLRRIRMVR
jgi:hypothetical protein